MRHLLTDDLWAAMAPLVTAAKRHRGGQPPVPPDRRFFEALLYLARTGVAWRDLPAEFGAGDAVSHRPRRWVGSGGPRRRFEGMTAGPQCGGVRRVRVGSAIVRAHHHAAGAPRKRTRSGGPGRPRPEVSAAAAAG